jgi:hypothetical protein
MKHENVEKDLNSTEDIISFRVSSKIGVFTLIYRIDGQDDIELDIRVLPI